MEKFPDFARIDAYPQWFYQWAMCMLITFMRLGPPTPDLEGDNVYGAKLYIQRRRHRYGFIEPHFNLFFPPPPCGYRYKEQIEYWHPIKRRYIPVNTDRWRQNHPWLNEPGEVFQLKKSWIGFGLLRLCPKAFRASLVEVSPTT